ncbi:hypothetical protein VTL71DRAFT_14071 [Oculimacula yallundae]|uniref:EF-hand domain-containing protein n=1 Tax=Oculimacula yallundae TaxID=86028 RepID=A0ABR4CIS7_9HELO
MLSDINIESAFSYGDNDGDERLSLSEAAKALEPFGTSVDEKDIEEAAESLGISFEGREVDGRLTIFLYAGIHGYL